MTNAVIDADFVDTRRVKSRGVLQIIVEVDIEREQSVMETLGWPKPSISLPVAIARLTEPGRGSLPSSAPGDGSDSGSNVAPDNAPSGEGQGPNSPRPLSAAQDAYRHTLKRGFLQWLGVDSREAAEEKIEKKCGVISLAELDADKTARNAWNFMKTQFAASGFDRNAA